jgi:autotransporter-associated beta strand protein
VDAFGTALTVSSATTTVFTGAIGATNAPSALTVNGAGSTTINSPTISTAGSQSYNQPITLGANVMFQNSAGTTTIGSTMDGAHQATFAGTASITANVGGSTRLTKVSTFGSTNVNGASIKTSGDQTYGGTLSTSLSVGIDSSGGDASFSTLSGSGTLTIAAQHTSFNGTASIGTLNASAGGPTTIATSSVFTQGDQTYGGSVTLAVDAGLSVGFGSTLTIPAGTVSLGTHTLTVGNGGSIAAAISGSGGLIHNGGGLTQTLTLSGANNYTGPTTLNSMGNVALGASNAIPSGSALTVNSSAGFLMNGFSDTVGSLAGAGNVSLGAGTLTAGGNNTSTTFSGAISGAGGFTKAGSATLTLSGANTYGGTTTINAGTLKQGAAGGIPSNPVALANTAGASLDLNNLALSLPSISGGGASGGNVQLGSATLTLVTPGSASYAGQVSGTGGLTMNGSGTQTLAGQSNYTGTTSISNGTVALGVGDALPPATTLTTTGGVLDAQGNSQHVGILSGGGIVTNAAGTPATFTVNNGVADSFGGTIEGNLSFAKTGVGGLTLSGGNTYAGGTAIDGGQLVLFGPDRLPTGTTLTVANVAGAGLDLHNQTQTIAGLAGGGPSGGGLNMAAGHLSVDGTAPTAYGGVISGAAGSLTKAGASTLTLSGDNTYTGLTTVSGGVLRVNGSQPGSAVTLAGGTLGGSGTVGDVSQGAGASGLAPGASPGILHTGNLTLGPLTTVSLELNGSTPGSGYDQLVASPAANVAPGGATLSVSVGFTPALNQLFTVIDNQSATPVAGTFAGLAEGASLTAGGDQLQISYIGGDGNDVTLKNLTAPPSPPPPTPTPPAAGPTGQRAAALKKCKKKKSSKARKKCKKKANKLPL